MTLLDRSRPGCRFLGLAAGATPATQQGHSRARGFTLVEMLVAMAITLVMMAAVVTLFANVTSSVSRSRATMEMSGQIRSVRNVLQQDLQGATCPGITWQRPESNHGYIELIEGPYREGNASRLIDGIDRPGAPDFNPEIDHPISVLPSSNLDFTTANPTWATDGAGLGDYDDILMLTVRNEQKPFVGRIPSDTGDDSTSDGDPRGFAGWSYETIESPLAEVVWFSIENPSEAENTSRFFGEPGMRTIYRRALLIAPWVNPLSPGANPRTGLTPAGYKPVPGLVRVLPGTVKQQDMPEAIAALVAFQDRYDLSVRLEWDLALARWKIVANTLGDLTKRENRYGHVFYRPVASGSRPVGREYPYAVVSSGSGYVGSSADLQFFTDPDPSQTPTTAAKAEANFTSTGGAVLGYNVTLPGANYVVRPFVYVDKDSTTIATARAMLNDDGEIVRIVQGPVPLWGTRRGEDVMLTDALAFDLRVFDPGAPLFATRKKPGDRTSDLDVVLTPSDIGWRGSAPRGLNGAYFSNDNMGGANGIGSNDQFFPYVGQGAYVDMGYGYDPNFTNPSGPAFPAPRYASGFTSSAPPWFFTPRSLTDAYGTQMAPGYAVYDTGSFHYENNGVNEDESVLDSGTWKLVSTLNAATYPTWRGIIDQGTDGLDNNGQLGVDDVGERETTLSYDKRLRGVQVLIRGYERDSRSIKQVRVNQHFMPE